jgi:ABC-type transport system involved in cytochrome bd biosynthesis fused ATPase/permease subunit
MLRLMAILRTGIPLLAIFVALSWLAAQAGHSHLIAGIVLALILSYAIFVVALLMIERKRARYPNASHSTAAIAYGLSRAVSTDIRPARSE